MEFPFTFPAAFGDILSPGDILSLGGASLMALPKLNLVPEQDGYSIGEVEGAVLSAKLDGGLSRQRLDIIGGALPVSVQWALNPTQFAYFQGFVRDAIGYGTAPFLIDLLLEGSAPQECKAAFVPKSRALRSIRGHRHVVSAELEVELLAGGQTTVPGKPVIHPLPSPLNADDIPIAGTCDWTTEAVALLLDGSVVATIVPLGRTFTWVLSGVADGVHTLTATASNSAGTSIESEPVLFYQGAAAEAGTFTFDGMELFED